MIIGLAGAAGCGKTTAAGYLAERYGYTRIRFSGPLKNMLRSFFRDCGLSEAEIERRIEGDLKDVPDPLLGGQTPREGMIGIGYDWGRDKMHPHIWTNAWQASAQAALVGGVPGVVAEDVRNPEEVDTIHALGGTVVRIRRPGLAVGSHISEAQSFRVYATIHNDGPVTILAARLEGILNRYERLAG
ncbi:deoxynucleotide monophosphate kinase [Methylobacterium nigriterrae]|uniref:deoxynucleotide monophosphate kinase n=1 Tax=Methylobacterium nigriterrae TaxID=3127512 RepID=UPI003013FA8B